MSTYTETITNLVNYLNMCRNEYYNNSNSPISDEQYDDLFDKLKQLEEESGIILANSPTQTVGYEVRSELEKVTHKYPLLSLDKTKSFDDITLFCGNERLLLMHKLDGLTVQLTYRNGELVMAETRGDGIQGEDITHNARTFLGVPAKISVTDEVRFTGEAIILKNDFEKINASLDFVYKNPRNLVSGSVRQLDSSICAKRCVRFIVWNANDVSKDGTMLSGLQEAMNLGFTTVYAILYNTRMTTPVNVIFNNMRNNASDNYIPIDGIVAMYDDIEYGKSLGKTNHHFRNGIAYKFYDEGYETTITGIEYTIGKTGTLTPTAVFKPVDIDGVTVTRASVHNISILAELNLCIGDTVEVYRANEVIPQVRKNLTTHYSAIAYEETIPDKCPYCGASTYREISDGTEVLVCTGINTCKGQLLKKLSAFVSKGAMNIDGLSEKTLERFIDLGYIKTYSDIYTEIEKHKVEICQLDGFGEKSVETLLKSIEKSKNTTFERLLIAINIPNVGKQAATDIAKFFDNDPYKIIEHGYKTTGLAEYYNGLLSIDGFGEVIARSVVNTFSYPEFYNEFEKLVSILNFDTTKHENMSTKLAGLKFVITGKLNTYTNRDELVTYITNNGGTVQSGVNKDTSYLINNDIASTSGKNKKAKELNIPIISEKQFIDMFVNSTVESVPQTTTQKSTKKKLF